VNDQISDGVITLMRDAGIPLTRTNYLRTNFLGNPPEELGPELLEGMPRFVRRRRIRFTRKDRRLLRRMGIKG